MKQRSAWRPSRGCSGCPAAVPEGASLTGPGPSWPVYLWPASAIGLRRVAFSQRAGFRQQAGLGFMRAAVLARRPRS